MSIEIARKLIEEWLLQRGFRIVDKLSEKEIVLMEGNNTVYLRISTEEFPTESYIIDELSNVMRNRFNYNKAYIAFPQSARGLINGKLFRSNRVGVYIYDLSSTDPERAVEELIPSIPIQLQQGIDDSIKKRIDDLEKAINDVRNSLSGINIQPLTKDINELRDRVMRIEQIINELIERVNKLERIGLQATGLTNTTAQGGSTINNELPDFLSNNPWIEVLRRRGGGNG
ncbi:hypothetical protein [Vulcanisaeta distributa]|uniref:Uncharacterized protein n=1 Tax=Vulcanisaeta distributa (strain DSM 14429 / JCM 11212 / NBRC 100878 / IC-017) TaxID=572478 RepID=E1QR06_VULDI|nr:hypothetical protein [Vulcanisaeta distributa]ADN50576.1 hypothetical protein Vdis_1190 [Vulcanisaeta distributa DSM 14429]